MGFLKNLVESQLEAAKRSITKERIEELEAQGYDMSEYREALAAKQAEEEGAYRDLRSKHQNPTDLNKLEPYMKTPRSTETPFFRAVAGRAPLFGKSKWRTKYSEGKIVYLVILDCPDEALAPPMNDDGYYCIALYAIDDAHARSEEWLRRVLNALRDMRDGKRDTPNDCLELVDMMRNKHDESDWRSGWLGQSIAEGARAYYFKHVLFTKDLPQGFIPDSNILPALCTSIPQKEGRVPLISKIPPAFYV